MLGGQNMEILDQDIQRLSMETNFWTWSAQGSVNPIPIKNAKGVYFWDTNGKRYLDLNSMTMCVNIGHGDERVVEAIAKQARELSFAGPKMATRPRAILGQLLKEILPPGMNRFLFTLGGAEANENAIKLARGYTGRHKILTRYRSYHGATHGAIALTGDPRRVAWEPTVMPGVVHFLDPYRYRSTFHRTNPDISEEEFTRDYLNHLEEIVIYEGPQSIAAILIESVTGTNGIIIPPQGYLQGVRAICDKYGIVYIADEVMSGFGRTGEWFAVNHWNVIPDMITMAKGITSAYAPLGAVAMSQKIADAFKERPFISGLTYSGHPISLAAAIANIEVMKSDKLVERAAETGKYLSKKLEELKHKHASVGDVRSIGLFGVIELVRNPKTKEPLAPFNGSSPEMKAIAKFLDENGVFVEIHWHTILIIPPLIITTEQLDEGLEVVDRALNIADAAVPKDALPIELRSSAVK
jgi:taurine---2-oxoglutarate transaminase